MSSSDKITCSKGKSEGFSTCYEIDRGKGKGKKSKIKQDQPDMTQQSTSAIDGIQQLQQQAVVQLSLLSPHHTRPISSQSITGHLAGKRPPSRALPVAGTAEGQPKLTLPLLSLRHPQKTPAHTVPSSPVRAGTPQVPFKIKSQNSGSHLSQMSAPPLQLPTYVYHS